MLDDLLCMILPALIFIALFVFVVKKIRENPADPRADDGLDEMDDMRPENTHDDLDSTVLDGFTKTNCGNLVLLFDDPVDHLFDDDDD